MKKATTAFTLLGASAIMFGATLAQAQDWHRDWHPPLRFGYTSPWPYDGRNDRRDFPTNGYFPGNFAADPYAPRSAGFIGSRPEYSPRPYPSQVWFKWFKPPRSRD